MNDQHLGDQHLGDQHLGDQHLGDEAIRAFLEGNLDANTRKRLAAHLHRCQACDARLSSLSAVLEDKTTQWSPEHGVKPSHPIALDETVNSDPPQEPAAGSNHGSDTSIQATTDGAERAADSEVPAAVGRYVIQNEIARGGMGVVLRVRDSDFERSLAMKVSLLRSRGDRESDQRFLAEARITGRLQHPGIPPVHELGALADCRPYFVMKLIAGHTLAELLKHRKSDRSDLPEFMGIFEQVCQTMAYAHTEQVIHRDLKPSNIMVGAFGEVQVMDWGLAKSLSLRQSKVVDQAPATRGDTEPKTISASEGEHTLDGTILGTPAYMAPEQARGEIEAMDKTSDVFGLGAILCQILTGSPPYRGRTSAETLAQASEGRTAGAIQRLEACEADEELIQLAKRCLAPARAQRPPDAAAVADAVAAYQHDVRERLRQTELRQAQAEVQIREEQKRRVVEQQRQRLWLSLAATLLLLVCGVAGVVIWYQQHRATQLAEETQRQQQKSSRQQRIVSEVDLALDESERHLGELSSRLADDAQAAQLLSSIGQWQALVTSATSAFERADKIAQADSALLPSATRERLRRVGTATNAARDNWEFARRLDEIRSNAFAPINGSLKLAMSMATDDFLACFDERGMNPSGTPEEARRLAETIRRSPIRPAIVAALDQWARIEFAVIGLDSSIDARQSIVAAGRLQEIARQADPHPWRDQVRDVATWIADNQKLGQLAAEVDMAEHSPDLLDVLAYFLGGEKELEFRRRALLVYPGNFYLTNGLAVALPASSERVSWYHAVIGIRPNSVLAWNNLGWTFLGMRQWDQARIALERALEIDPDYVPALANLGNALTSLDRAEEAIELQRRAIALLPESPKLSGYYGNLALALLTDGQWDEALQAARDAVDLDPEYALAYNALGSVQAEAGNWREAIEAFKRAAELDADETGAYAMILQMAGANLAQDGKYDEAVAALQEAVGIDPADNSSRFNLGGVYFQLGDFERAREQYEKCANSDSESYDIQEMLGRTLLNLAQAKEAAAAFRRAIKLDPQRAKAHYNLGVALNQSDQHRIAIPHFRRASELDPRDGSAFYNLGTALLDHDQLEEAEQALRKASELIPDKSEPWQNLGKTLQRAGKLDEAEAAYRQAIKVAPVADSYSGLAATLLEMEHFAEAEEQYRKALQVDDSQWNRYYGLGLALRNQQKLAEALEAFGQALGLAPDDAELHLQSGLVLQDLHRPAAALQAFRQAAKLDQGDVKSRHALAQLLSQQPTLEASREAEKIYREILSIDAEDALAQVNLGNTLAELQRLDEAIAAYRKAIEINPAMPDAYDNLAVSLDRQGKLTEAVEAYQRALELRPNFGHSHWGLGISLRRLNRLDDSVQALRRAKELLPNNVRVTQALSKTERWARFDSSFDEVSRGTKELASAEEYAHFADFCIFHRQSFAAAAQAFTQAFGETGESALAAEVPSEDKRSHLYNAACAAVLTSTGKASDLASPDEDEVVSLRKRALNWLRADLEIFQQQIKDRPAAAAELRSELRHWLSDSDLAAVRDPQPLASLPAAEAEQWQALWAAAAKATQ